jgi:hypothetical protein
MPSESPSQFSDLSQYIDLTIFPIVFASQLFVFIKRRFRLDVSAIITLVLYLLVMLIRFIRCFIQKANNRLNPI